MYAFKLVCPNSIDQYEYSDILDQLNELAHNLNLQLIELGDQVQSGEND